LRAREVAAALLVLWAALATGLAAEDGGEEEEFDSRVFVDTEDEATGDIKRAWRARNTEPPNWRKAIEIYLRVVREYGHTVYPQSDRLYLPVSGLVRRELASLPGEGRDLYRVLKLREAELAFRRAEAAGSAAEMEKVAEYYPCLPTAPRALYVLGEWARARGEPNRAVYYWQRLVSEYPDWEQGSKAALLARSALVAVESGRRAEGQRLLADLRKTSGLIRLRVGGKEMMVADEIARRLELGGRAQPGAADSSGFWPSIGGSAAHDRVVARAVDAGVPRRPLPLSAAAAPKLPQYQAIRRGTPAPKGPGRRHPVCAGGTVILAGDSDVLAVRGRSGKPIWPATKNSKPDFKLPCSRMTLPAIGEGRVFAVLGVPQRSSGYAFRRGNQTFRSNVTLRAYALSGGKLKWESGRRDSGAVREFLRSVDLSAAPVYHGGYVYCPAIKRSSIDDAFLLCFDASDGRLVWKTFVCAGHPLRAGHYYNAFAVAEDCLPPAVSEGLVALVTNLGAVGVMDAASGSLLWVYLYDRVEAGSNQARMIVGRQVPTAPSMWGPSAPVISGGVIYAAPQDCPDLLALDLTSGAIRWKSPRADPDHGDLSHLVGISGDYLVCSGGRQVVIFSARTGKRLRRVRLMAAEAGLGLVGAGFAIIPSKEGLERICLETGKILATYRFKDGEAEAGNLLVCDDVLLSASQRQLGAYYCWDEVVASITKRLKADPDAATPRAELGEIHFSADRYREAADYFKQALARVKPGEERDHVPLEPEVRRHIWESHSRLAEALEKKGKFAEALVDFGEAHKYAQSDGERMTGHLRFARCREGLKEWAAAVAEYQEVIYSGKSLDAKTGRSRYYREKYRAPSGRGVMAGPYAKAQIDSIVAEHGREAYARFEEAASEMLAEATAAGDVEKAARIVEWYPNSEALSPALILIARLHAAAGRHKEAVARLREHMNTRRNSPRAPEVYARLGLIYLAQNRAGPARSVMGSMLRRWPDGKFDLDDRAWSVKDFVEEHIPEAARLARGEEAADLRAPLRTAWKAATGGGALLVPKGDEYDVSGTLFLRRSSSDVLAVNLASGKVDWRRSGFSRFGSHHQYQIAAVAAPGVVAVGSGEKLVGLAPGDGQTLWEVPLAAGKGEANRRVQYCLLAAGEGVVAAGALWTGMDPRTRQYRQRVRLVALDEATGEQYWELESDHRVVDLQLKEGLIYVSTYDQRARRSWVRAYEVVTGEMRFQAGLTKNQTAGAMYLHDDRLLVSCRTEIYCFDARSGKLKWRNATGGANAVVLAADETRVVAAVQVIDRGRQSSKLIAWDTDGGKRLWSSGKLEGLVQGGVTMGVIFAPGGQPVPVASDTAVVAVALREFRKQSCTVVAYDGATGKLRWRSTLPRGSFASPVLTGRGHAASVVYGRGGTERRVWNLGNGKLVERQRISGGSGTLTVQEGEVLQVTSADVQKLAPAAEKQKSSGPAAGEPGKDPGKK
jgi:outer membrane protein assembly factor BamB/tetratricopeptide (TPR) repeat protein